MGSESCGGDNVLSLMIDFWVEKLVGEVEIDVRFIEFNEMKIGGIKWKEDRRCEKKRLERFLRSQMILQWGKCVVKIR